jgi:hypothetical protein
MKSASINELKKELNELTAKELAAYCIKLAKYKKENKELLSYLIFDANDENLYIKNIQNFIDELFLKVPIMPYYTSAKVLRKVLRLSKKYIKFSGQLKTEIEVLIYFCQCIRKNNIAIDKNNTLFLIYQKQLATIEKQFVKLDEDLQFDYKETIESLHQLS